MNGMPTCPVTEIYPNGNDHLCGVYCVACNRHSCMKSRIFLLFGDVAVAVEIVVVVVVLLVHTLFIQRRIESNFFLETVQCSTNQRVASLFSMTCLKFMAQRMH